MTATQQLLDNNRDYVAGFDKASLPPPPAKKVAVLACMDARLDPARALGLEEGDAHVIRNAGGVASEDAIRSLVISQRLLGTEEIILIHHSDCGMETFDDDTVKATIEASTGIRPSFALEAFPDADDDILQTIARIKASPFIPHKDKIRGFVYDVETGELRKVSGASNRVARPLRVTATDQLLSHNLDYAAGFDKGDLPLPPAQKVAVLACMDARLDPARALGLEEGDAHVIRNAGGVATVDAIRSLAISQRLLGTEEIILIHHSDCGMETFDDDTVKATIEADTGIRPSFALEAFPHAEADVVQTIARIKASPFIPHKDKIRGFVYEVETGQLREVSTGPKALPHPEPTIVGQRRRGATNRQIARAPRDATEQLLDNNAKYVASFDKGDLPLPPAKKVAVLACMDARLDPARALGLEEGDAHVIRNAGGVATVDAIRSLVISQRLLGTEEIVLIHHTDCGMETFHDDAVKDTIEADTGIRPSFALEAFPDADADVLQTIARIKASPFVPKTSAIRGFVYEVETGRLREVAAAPPPSQGFRPLRDVLRERGWSG